MSWYLWRVWNHEHIQLILLANSLPWDQNTISALLNWIPRDPSHGRWHVVADRSWWLSRLVLPPGGIIDGCCGSRMDLEYSAWATCAHKLCQNRSQLGKYISFMIINWTIKLQPHYDVSLSIYFGPFFKTFFGLMFLFLLHINDIFRLS